jgi:hypothetical protein
MTFHPEQEDNLERVSARIERHILAFVEHLSHQAVSDFHMDELTAWVRERSPETAPDSPSRVLRLMRCKKAVNYEILSRSDSHYRFIPVDPLDTEKVETKASELTPTHAERALAVEELHALYDEVGGAFSPTLLKVCQWLSSQK